MIHSSTCFYDGPSTTTTTTTTAIKKHEYIAIIFFCSSFPVSQTIFSLPLHYRKTHVCHLVLPYILDTVCSSADSPSCLLFFFFSFFVQTGLKRPPFTFFLLPFQSLNDALLRLTFLQNHFQHVESLEKVKEKVIEKEDRARVTTQKLQYI